MIAVLQDYDNHERLHTEFVTLDLSALPSEITVAPTSTPAPQASDFQTLQKGSKGDAVRTLQKRLKELGMDLPELLEVVEPLLEEEA